MKRVANPIETENLCSYGCGNTAKFINGSGKLMCQDRSNKCPAIKEKNSSGGKRAYDLGKRKPAILRYKELPQETKDKMNWNKGKFTGTKFYYDGRGNHKSFLIEERGHICELCRNSEWLGKPITLELEHIDGDNRNNEKNNLKLLCPNCHSQTDTWKGRNKNSIRNRNKTHINDEDFLDAINTTPNVRQALLKLGLTAKASNYERAYELKFGGMVKLANTSDLSSDASA
jgi:hypothetical protein